jgi:hypothetical protein
MVLAHIAGIPVEETALSFGPVVAAAGGLTALRIRERIRVGRRRAAALRRQCPSVGRKDG